MIANDPDNAMTPSGTLSFRIQDDIEDASAFKIGNFVEDFFFHLNKFKFFLFFSFFFSKIVIDPVIADPISGLITTLKPLDRETKASYKIIIEVSDNGQPPQSATRVLRINILDIDDHEPRFAREIVSCYPFNFNEMNFLSI